MKAAKILGAVIVGGIVLPTVLMLGSVISAFAGAGLIYLLAFLLGG